MKKIALLLSFLVSVLVLTACPGVTPPALKATINSFTATPPSLPAGGGSVTLNWDVNGATTLTIDAGVGEVTGSSKTVSVSSSKIFTLTAVGAGGSVTKTAEVTVLGGADITPPTIVSVSPANGATGVTSDATIVITFSEKMERVSTQASYQSADLPVGSFTFFWNKESSVLSIKPNAPLIYAAGVNDPATIVAKNYTFRLTNTAKDAPGNPLSEVSSSFTTLREVHVSIKSQATLNGWVANDGQLILGSESGAMYIGDGATNRGYRGFTSFDLSAIPGGVSGAAIKSAMYMLFKTSVVGDPYIDLNDCIPTQVMNCGIGTFVHLDHVSYGPSLEATDYNAGFLGELGSFDTFGSNTFGYRTKDITAALSNDLINRDARGSRSQYRLSFPLPSDNDGSPDLVTFVDSNTNVDQAPYLIVTYLIP